MCSACSRLEAQPIMMCDSVSISNRGMGEVSELLSGKRKGATELGRIAGGGCRVDFNGAQSL
jgi:hypothetical protein